MCLFGLTPDLRRKTAMELLDRIVHDARISLAEVRHEIPDSTKDEFISIEQTAKKLKAQIAKMRELSPDDMRLRRCPLCKGEATIESYIEDGHSLERYRIKCKDCHLELTHIDKELAIEHWNKRKKPITHIDLDKAGGYEDGD